MVFLLPSSSPLHKQLLDSDPLSPDLASRLGEKFFVFGAFVGACVAGVDEGGSSKEDGAGRGERGVKGGSRGVTPEVLRADWRRRRSGSGQRSIHMWLM
jgi:hypothetical protein